MLTNADRERLKQRINRLYSHKEMFLVQDADGPELDRALQRMQSLSEEITRILGYKTDEE